MRQDNEGNEDEDWPPAEHFVSTGLSALDEVLDGLRIGDNVVWQVDDLADYRRVVEPFVAAAEGQGRTIVYLRYGQHPPLLTANAASTAIRVVEIDALGGFEGFTRRVYQLISDYGRGAFYVCDCLSDLLEAWATDAMVGNFFRVVCPYLFELDTVAYFALLPQRHSPTTLSRIRSTTQVLIDVRCATGQTHVQPVKVWQRASPTMFLPHRWEGERLTPVTDSHAAIRLQAALERAQQRQRSAQRRLLDYWDRLFLTASEALAAQREWQGRAAHVAADRQQRERCERVRLQILEILISRDERMQALARRYLTLEDLLAVRARMIGSGSIGGKAVGMLLARKIVEREAPRHWVERMEPHDSFYVGSDVYYAYLVHNGWWPRLMRHRCESGAYYAEGEALAESMRSGEMPGEVRLELERVLDYFGQYPILVRSSSLHEDGFDSAFAGKYESVFCVNQGSPEARLAELEEAIRRVYASTMSEDALVYRQQRGLAQHEEPMALLLQRVNGRYHGRYYFPDAAAVGVSRNAFVWDREMDPAAGMLRLVAGLGTRAVDRIGGDHACVVALDQPHKRPYADREALYRYTQHQVDLLDIAENRLTTLPLRELQQHAPQWPLAALGETDREASARARAIGERAPVWRLTFAPLLRNTAWVEMVRGLLNTLEQAYGHPVDIELTLHLSTADPGAAASAANAGSVAAPTPVGRADRATDPADSGSGTGAVADFNLVQCRPLATLGSERPQPWPDAAEITADRVLFATQGSFMGGNVDLAIERIVRIDPQRYAALNQAQKYAVARIVGAINRQQPAGEQSRTMLIGPGRWGTSSPELGVPVRFADINRVAVLVEVAELGGGMVPDLSYGSHFFQDLVESRIAYVALFPSEAGCSYHPEWLAQWRPIHRLPRSESSTPTPTEAVGEDDPTASDDPQVAAAIEYLRIPAPGLRVVSDIVEQRLLCWRPPSSEDPQRIGDPEGGER